MFGRGVVAPRRRARRQLPASVDCGLVASRVTQRLPNPLRDAHAVPLCHTTDLVELVVFQQDLHSCSHAMSMFDSSQ